MDAATSAAAVMSSDGSKAEDRVLLMGLLCDCQGQVKDKSRTSQRLKSLENVKQEMRIWTGSCR